MPETTHLLLVNVGNSRVRAAAATWTPDAPVDQAAQLLRSTAVRNNEATAAALLRPLEEHFAGADAPDTVRAVIASVNPELAKRLSAELAAHPRVSAVLPVLGAADSGPGRDGIPIPLTHALSDASTLGQDRALNAVAAFAVAKSACVVIDAGTAITIDFVDGAGTYHGGAILPGVDMMAAALHEHTASLPRIQPNVEHGRAGDAEEGRPFGHDTVSAMNTGIAAAAVGAAHLLINRYAEFYEAYPRVIATGGDAGRLFESDELVEHLVPDLTLRGVLESFRAFAEADEAGDDA